ncbi:class I SAM-dependent methyltransferase [Flindersiella endophytica]
MIGELALDLATFEALLRPEGQELLELAHASYTGASDAVAVATRLRKTYPAELVAAALTQVELRGRAAAKFGADSAAMYFTRDGMEQATTAAVAAHRAERIGRVGRVGRVGRLGGGSVADLCCGIGGDLLGLARAGIEATGVDRDPLTAAIARANLSALGLARPGKVAVEVADVETHDRSPYDGVVVDPARRNARGRTFDPDDYSPPWSFVLDVLAGDACVKTAPGLPHALVPPGVEAEWVSERGEVKEAALWSGRYATGARRRATVLPADATLTEADDPGEADVREPQTYLYEPDGAVIRAGLVTAVAPLIDGGMLHPKIAYLTSDRLTATPFATAYRVLDVFPYDLKLLKRELRARQVGTLTIKRRGLDLDPVKLRKQLIARGPATATLVITRTEQRTLALLVDPVAQPV